MEQECKDKALEALNNLRAKNVTKNQKRYKDEKGLCCFNGHILEACTGKSLPIPINDQDYRFIGRNIHQSMLSLFGIDEDTYSNTITPIREINDIHSRYCDGVVTFRTALRWVKEIIQSA